MTVPDLGNMKNGPVGVPQPESIDITVYCPVRYDVYVDANDGSDLRIRIGPRPHEWEGSPPVYRVTKGNEDTEDHFLLFPINTGKECIFCASVRDTENRLFYNRGPEDDMSAYQEMDHDANESDYADALAAAEAALDEIDAKDDDEDAEDES